MFTPESMRSYRLHEFGTVDPAHGFTYWRAPVPCSFLQERECDVFESPRTARSSVKGCLKSRINPNPEVFKGGASPSARASARARSLDPSIRRFARVVLSIERGNSLRRFARVVLDARIKGLQFPVEPILATIGRRSVFRRKPRTANARV